MSLKVLILEAREDFPVIRHGVPRAVEIPKPMPDAPPVTSATLPFSTSERNGDVGGSFFCMLVAVFCFLSNNKTASTHTQLFRQPSGTMGTIAAPLLQIVGLSLGQFMQ